MTENNKSGAGKFILGALIGAAAGAIAGRFISTKVKGEGEEGLDCGCGGKNCACSEKSKKAEKVVRAETVEKAEKPEKAGKVEDTKKETK